MPKGSSELNRATEPRAFQPVMAKKRMSHKDWRPGRPTSSLPSGVSTVGRRNPWLSRSRWVETHKTSLRVLSAGACWVAIACAGLPVPTSQANVALMAGQAAKPLNGNFNSVPVLHSNQPEEVEGPGILINTSAGVSYVSETGVGLVNPEYTFSGDFGVHLHHKYIPGKDEIWAGKRRGELTLGLVLINTSQQTVHIRFQSGAVRNSFQAPYLANNLMGVKPLGIRAWNTGPGDATATQLLREKLDSNLSDEITIPGRSRLVLFRTELPALGIANALLKGRSDGPFQMAVVAARKAKNDYDIVAVLDQAKLAPGRVYLDRVPEINNRQLFSRVGGVAIGDTYQASINHDLNTEGPLHVPLTSTIRNNFGTNEIQVNPLASRMVDSSLDNVGTYGVRYEVTLNLVGAGPYELVMSHPSTIYGSKRFTAFRGSIQIKTEAGIDEVHVGMRSGESLSLASLNLKPGIINPVKLTMVYPADATPGHLLSVVSARQLAQAQNRERPEQIVRAVAPKDTARKTTYAVFPLKSLSSSCANDLGSLYLQGACLEAPPAPVNGKQEPRPGSQLNVTQSVLQKYEPISNGIPLSTFGQQDR